VLLFELVNKLAIGQRRLIGEFLANIGVAWFVAGVVNPFVSRPKSWEELAASLIWGVSFAVGFLRAGIFFVKGVKS